MSVVPFLFLDLSHDGSTVRLRVTLIAIRPDARLKVGVPRERHGSRNRLVFLRWDRREIPSFVRFRLLLVVLDIFRR